MDELFSGALDPDSLAVEESSTALPDSTFSTTIPSTACDCQRKGEKEKKKKSGEDAVREERMVFEDQLLNDIIKTARRPSFARSSEG